MRPSRLADRGEARLRAAGAPGESRLLGTPADAPRVLAETLLDDIFTRQPAIESAMSALSSL